VQERKREGRELGRGVAGWAEREKRSFSFFLFLKNVKSKIICKFISK
jgi:hypothetical protein